MAHKKIPPPTGGPADPHHDPYEHHITSLLGIALTRRQFALDRAAQLPADSAEALRCQGQAIAYGEMVELLRQAVREAVQQC